ncbi:hypothetical protein NEMIN01_0558 [Nematocida minor]|uniref:uncharacterized protein n=1 Tax=Nematocida minor TaxID=1912983 RepID=UPI00221EDD73|nr:uncharacterized protein NEMIN01_0558 [Nematocida minor]KAI5189495.1 hypothetical protein NEMIN01_0558 [Nematocida minor]
MLSRKKQIKRILGAGTSLAFFVERCTGSWYNIFREEASSSNDLHTGDDGLANEIDYLNFPSSDSYIDGVGPPSEGHDSLIRVNDAADYYPQIDSQCVEGPGASGSILSETPNNPSISKDESRVMSIMDDLDLSSSEIPVDDSSSLSGYDPNANIITDLSYPRPDQYIAGPTMYDYAFSDAYSMPSTSDVMHSFGHSSFIHPYVNNSIYGEYEPFAALGEMPYPYTQIEQYTAEPYVAESAFKEELPGGSRAFIGEKRKASEKDKIVYVSSYESMLEKEKQKKKEKTADAPSTLDQKKEDENSAENNREEEQDSYQKEEGSFEKTRDRQKMKEISIWLWNERRLMNTRRKGYKTSRKAIVNYKNSSADELTVAKFKMYQQKLKKDVKEFFTQCSSLIKTNALLYFIASRSASMNIKYIDLLEMKKWLVEEESKAYREIVMGLKGYYSGVVEDMIGYMEKHQPMKTSKFAPLTVWKETIGDIYVRVYPSPNYFILAKQNKINRVGKGHHALVYALCMILQLSEVYQDFSMITEDLIKETYTADDSYNNFHNNRILLCLHKIVRMRIEEDEDETVYGELYSVFRYRYGEKTLQTYTIYDMYKSIYSVLGKFYERVAVFDKSNKYILAGKCMITNQRYIKCELTESIAPNDPNDRVLSPTYSLEENKWNVSPDIHRHYHVHYVDNATNRLKILCMPIYVDENEQEHYLHTIGCIVEYIKVLYELEIESDLIHPFKIRKGTRKWSYIKKEERNKTVKDFAGHEVFFYYIKEYSEMSSFTFAEFWSLSPHNANVICIPLFLTPLMQAAVELGPFAMEKEHSKLSSIELEEKVPDVYKYDESYNDKEYSDIHNYYSNLYIVLDAEKEDGVDCYVMDYKSSRKEDNAIKIEWYVRMPSSIDEYTHFVPDKAFKKKENSDKFNAFIKTLESREHNRDSDLQGVWLRNNAAEEDGMMCWTQKIFNFIHDSKYYNPEMAKKGLNEIKRKIEIAEEKFKRAEEAYKTLGKINTKEDTDKKKQEKNSACSKKCRARKKLEALYKDLYIKLSKKPDLKTEFIVFRNVNRSKSNLGAHNEVLDVLISSYRCQFGDGNE